MTSRPVLSYESVKAPKAPKPRVGVRKVNPTRRGHRYPGNVNEPLRVFVRGLACILDGAVDRNGVAHRCSGPVAVCHLKTRGSGGPDDDNVFPGCYWNVGRIQEGCTKEFEYQWRVRLKPLCRKITAAFYRVYPQLRKRRTEQPA